MKKLLNTLYVTSENSYLALDGENIVIYEEQEERGRLPLHNLEGIVSFGYRGTSPALMGACADRNISLCYVTPQGRFLARVTGKVRGNVLLRKQQYESSQDNASSLEIAKNCIVGKVYNARWVLERAVRDHPLQVDVEKMKNASQQLKNSLIQIQSSESKEQLRGYEGEAASVYFGVFDELILQQKKEFFFHGRSKRPPMDNVNAMLSFTYTLLTNNIVSALECVGLDSCVGYLHTERPGRASLALDLIEELRPVLADRFVLSLINKKIVTGKNFTKKENGAVLMDDEIRKKFLTEWQKKKKETITHPYLNEKIEWGMIPYVQSMSETEREELRRNFAQVSISCHSMEDMELAVQAGASQIILGTIFETDCKKGLQGKGVEFVRQICARCPVPVYAIGGMNLERISLVRQAGAAGGCMMSGFMKL